MSKFFWSKRLITFVSPILLCTLSIPAVAAPSSLPPGWHAKKPIHKKPGSTHALLVGPSGFSPAQIKQAYGFPANQQGAGQVIAIVDAFDDPNIEADLATFSTQFGLPACTTANGCFTKLFPGGTTPTSDSDWGLEISLDVEWAHAIAPQAKILLIEAADDGQGLYDAVTFAIQQKATVISLSWGGAEFSGETQMDPIFQASTVPIVVASGDSGEGVNYPAVSPYVVAAGGTELTLNSNGTIASETAWSGSGGGISAFETEPAGQKGYVIPQANGKRGVPDVAYNAAPNSGYSVYDSFDDSGWQVVGGTSASAPQWAALIAVMKSAKNGNFGSFTSSIYSVARTAGLLHDTTTGENGTCGYVCTARPGYDYVTGLGSPQSANLITRFE
jgi:subtilase family serine protease